MFKKFQERLWIIKKVQGGSRMFNIVHECSRRFNKVPEGIKRFYKVQEDSGKGKMFHKVQEGLRMLKT